MASFHENYRSILLKEKSLEMMKNKITINVPNFSSRAFRLRFGPMCGRLLAGPRVLRGQSVRGGRPRGRGRPAPDAAPRTRTAESSGVGCQAKIKKPEASCFEEN